MRSFWGTLTIFALLTASGLILLTFTMGWEPDTNHYQDDLEYMVNMNALVDLQKDSLPPPPAPQEITGAPTAAK